MTIKFKYASNEEAKRAEAVFNRLSSEREQAVRLLRNCVDAAAIDIVEDFSAVSDAADAALGFLAQLDKEKT